jgi:hypothetical protein
MGRANVWDLMVDTLGVRGARRVGSFMECWAITERRWSEEPVPDRFTHEWEMSAAEVDYFLREFRRAFPAEHSPTRIVRDVRALVGHVGIDALQTATLDLVRP